MARRFAAQATVCPVCRTLDRTGSRIAIRIAMIAITTSSSTRVNPRCFRFTIAPPYVGHSHGDDIKSLPQGLFLLLRAVAGIEVEVEIEQRFAADVAGAGVFDFEFAE